MDYQECWNCKSWQNKKDFANQLPVYKNSEELNRVKDRIKQSKPLVSSFEIDNFKKILVKVSNGDAFVMQGGDCAESFKDFSENNVINTANTLEEMSKIINNHIKKEVITVGRIAGQFAKPRSNQNEIIENISLPSYKGDIINRIFFNKESREPNANLMIQAYNQSLETINILKKHKLNNLYISHEALLLDYEECFVKNNYLLSTHLPWLGDRTRIANSPHVEFLRGIKNPIGIKCGSTFKEKELLQIIKALNSNNEKGKIILITRFGKDYIKEAFPKLINTIKSNNLNVIWSCDPMHGNTKTTDLNIKTRYITDILNELEQFFDICKKNSILAGGIHLEMTGDNVSECANEYNDNIDINNYKSLCDPRLNRQQSLNLSSAILKFMK